ncbi:MAG TPA: hypothetical protein VMU33_01785 [Burkholderiaceae bacterium]|nr:hypothetical protein [Burkholderiaceae bacterium]
MKKLLAALSVAVPCAGASATGLYLQGGTLGVGAGAQFDAAEQFDVRADFNVLNFKHNVSTTDASYDARLKLMDTALLADYHPFSGAFRFSAGALVSNSKLTGTEVVNANGTVTINGNPYLVGAGDSVTFVAKFPSVRPYFGVGWGLTPATTGVFLTSDLGVAFGRPTVTVTATPNITALPGANSDISQEQATLQSKVDGARFYPVLRIGVGYAF